MDFLAASSKQPLATDIPSAKDLEIKSRAEERPGDPPLPPPLRTETVLKRDEWMLMPPTTPYVSATRTTDTPMAVDGDMTEGYGDSTRSGRTTNGTVDFFSSLGTEVKKKPSQPDRPDPDKVCRPAAIAAAARHRLSLGTAIHQPQRAQYSTQGRQGHR